MASLYKRVRGFLLILAGLAAFIPIVVFAQTGARATLTAPDLSAFPTVAAFLDVRDAGNNFVHGLSAGEVSLLENGSPVKLDTLQEVHPGLRWIVAINAGPALAIRNGEGISRYELLARALRAWAQAEQSSSPNDEYDLFTNTPGGSTHFTNPADWLAIFNAYQPDLRTAQPALDSLSLAMALATSSPAQPAVTSAILYITPSPDPSALASLADITQRAAQAHLPVFVWMASGSNTPAGDEDNALVQLAAQSGGQFFAFTGSETIPDISSYQDPLRSAYQLSYTSAIRKSGEDSLTAQVKQGDLQAASEPQKFSLDIQPPNPMFLTPPGDILRTSPENSSDPLAELSPSTYALSVLVEFPDGHTRPLKATRLYVDDQLVAENTAPPFDRFNWDVSGYTQDTTVTLKVEAQDSLGLTQDSQEIPVQVKVELPPSGLMRNLSRYGAYFGAAAAVAAGALLGLLIWRGGRSRQKKQSRRSLKDPVSQPVPIQGVEQKGLRRPLPPVAQLVRLSADNQPLTATPIALSAREITFGRDPAQATYTLNDPSVDGLHARLQRLEDGAFLLSDLGSVAGTWVNYTPVSGQGVRLEHGDLIHMGRAVFRFTLVRPGPARKPQITHYKESA